jgi:hypothetical protein
MAKKIMENFSLGFLNKKLTLYLVSFISGVLLISRLMSNDLISVLLFYLVAGFVFLYTKNMSAILLVSLIITFSYLFCKKSFSREGLENKEFKKKNHDVEDDYDSEDYDSEDYDSEDYDSEDYDSEDYDSEDYDSKDLDNIDMDNIDLENDVDREIVEGYNNLKEGANFTNEEEGRNTVSSPEYGKLIQQNFTDKSVARNNKPLKDLPAGNAMLRGALQERARQTKQSAVNDRGEDLIGVSPMQSDTLKISPIFNDGKTHMNKNVTNIKTEFGKKGLHKPPAKESIVEGYKKFPRMGVNGIGEPNDTKVVEKNKLNDSRKEASDYIHDQSENYKHTRNRRQRNLSGKQRALDRRRKYTSDNRMWQGFENIEGLQNNKKKRRGFQNNKPLDYSKIEHTPPKNNIPNKLNKNLTRADEMEAAYDNFEKVMGKGNIRSLGDTTTNLISKQKELLGGIKEMAPVLEKAMDVLNKFDFSSFTQSN